MAHTPETRQKVRAAYIYERFPLPEAADKHGVSYASAQTWKRTAKAAGDDWDRARSASRLAEGGLGDITQQILEDFALLFKSTIDDIKEGDYSGLQKAEAISRLSDSYVKTMKAASGGQPKLAKLSIAMEVLKEFAEFLAQHEPEAVPLFAKVLDAFAVRVNEVFGG